VDSAVTAYLLKAAGHDVIGMTLKTWLNSEGEVSRCCEIDDARRTAHVLDIPYYAVNAAGDFRKFVVEPFTAAYIGGMTPNPCIECNRAVKWKGMLDFADSMGAQFVATGHYSYIEKCENGRYAVKRSAYANKDQTYMLYRLTQQQLARTLMPLGALDKSEVRKIAEAAGLPIAAKPDSQEICFVADDDYANYIEHNSGEYIPQSGSFVDESGKVLGTHKGIIHYTVGQRKGLGIAMGYPVYVKSINAASNEVVLSDDNSLYNNIIKVDTLNFQSIPDIPQGEKVRALVRIRYHHAGEYGDIEKTGDDEVTIRFDKPVRAPAPGQSAVFYDEKGRVIGGGRIISSKNTQIGNNG
ncbi:MAG: tRNA 2-thiouridine(34) synthase MnmA, partial [Clostridia bacterium]|nr:tRNA 2-thiouridine(34) synthase MnmA [Clostridia bacterium]